LVKRVITSHTGIIYSATIIGDLIWTYSNDKKIQTWRISNDGITPEEYAPIKLDHRGSITALYVKASKKGYSLWSASSDQTINVHFLAKSYAKHISDSASNSSLQIPQKTTVSRRPELRGGGSNLKRATTIAGTNLTQKDKEPTDISKLIVMAPPPGTAAEGSPDPTSLPQPINPKEAQERRAQFAKRRTNSSGKKKIVVDEVRKSTSDDSTPTQMTTNLLSLPRSQKVKRTQTTFVSLRKSEKREKTPSPDLNNIIQ